MKLTTEQRYVIKELLKFEKQISVLSGAAGTGKSTVVQHISQLLPEFAYVAFTGKAASVLRKKGVNAQTIHSLIYKPLKDDYGNLILDKYGHPIFGLVNNLDVPGVICDESSMVSQEIYEDLCGFDVPLIFTGDSNQLEPIGTDFNIMKNPDFNLEKIHRNAGEIAFFGEHIRKGFKPTSFNTDKKVKFISKFKIDTYLPFVDQAICAFNKTRVEINKKVRVYHGFDPDKPVVGDKIICLRNNQQQGLFNGMQGIIKELDRCKILFTSEDGNEYNVVAAFDQFGREKYDFSHSREDPNPFDWAYGGTAHRNQGSEYDSVLVLEQFCQHWEHRRWCYTAATRAKNMLYWAS